MWENLLFNLLQIGLTVSAVALLPIVLRRLLKKRYPARAMCLVWALLAVRLLIPVQLTLPEPPVQVTPRINYVRYAPPAESETPGEPAQPTGRWMTAAEADRFAETADTDTGNLRTYWGNILVLIWLLGMAGFVFFQWYAYRRFVSALEKHAAAVQHAGLRTVLEREKQALGIAREIPLLTSGAADCPMLAGFFRPTLYLPDESLLERDASFIFRHELIHYRHGDLWLKLLLVLARAVQWFNPLVHLLARFAYEDIEMACDDAVAKGMDNAERRAYGETILRSAVKQAKRRTLVSCFTGDKKTLMRRFEGLFDTRAKKRGVALVLAAAVLVGTLGCAFSIGGSAEKLTEAELTELGRQWMSGSYRDAEPWYHMLTDEPANTLYQKQVAYGNEIGEAGGATPGEPMWHIGVSSPHVDRFAVLPDAEKRQAVIVTEWGISGSLPTRKAERIHFKQQNGVWKVDKVEGNPYINDVPFADAADSLETFCTLYQNDLGLPDYPAGSSGQHIWDEPTEVMLDPVRAAETVLQLADGKGELIRSWDVTNDGENDLAEVRYTFADKHAVRITMAPALSGRYTGEGGLEMVWFPQDWTAEDGTNSRTAADLTQQFARAVYHKSVWPLYTVQSAEQQQALVLYQLHLAEDAVPDLKEVWYTKLGGSSPTFRDFVVIPTDEPDACIAVFQMYGGGMTDYRSAQMVKIGQENGRTVITGIEQYDGHLDFMLHDMAERTAGYTQKERFYLYYNTGLSWPDTQGENPTPNQYYNSRTYRDLMQPVTAAQTVFDYFGEYVTYQTENGTRIELEQWFTVALLSQAGNDAVVRLTFADGSGPVDIHMQKNGDYWLPTGIADRFDETFRAQAGGSSLPVGASLEAAVAAAGGDIPILDKGTEIVLEPLAGKETVTSAAIADSVIREDGTLQYGAPVTQQKEISFARGESAYRYEVETNPAEFLSSTLSRYTYRGVSVQYEANGERYQACFVFRTENESVPVVDHSIFSTAYQNSTYGYLLTLPESFVQHGYVEERERGMVCFGFRDTDENTEDSLGLPILYVSVRGSAGLDASPDDVLLDEKDGLTYLASLPSYQPRDGWDTETTERYQRMYRDAETIGPDQFRLLTPGVVQAENRKTRLYTDQTDAYVQNAVYGPGGLLTQYAGASSRYAVNAADGTADVWYDLENQTLSDENKVFRLAERLHFGQNGEITRTEPLGDSRNGVTSSGEFLALYRNDAGFPTLSQTVLGYAQTDPQGSGLDTPAHAADTVLGTRGVQWTQEKTVQDENNVTLTGRLSDGMTLRLNLRRLQLTTERPSVYAPDDWRLMDANGETAGALGRQYSPYDSLLARAVDYYPYRTINELLWYLDMGWADGAYAEGIFAELDRRYDSDPEAVTEAIGSYSGWSDGSALRARWEQHRAQV